MPENILLIEDEIDFAESMMRTLRSAGYGVELAESVAEATKLLNGVNGSQVDIILSDIHLPDGNGLELLKVLHLRDPLRPIVLMTASGTADLAVEATLHGAFDYFLKPVGRAQLLDVVAKAVACRAMSRQLVSLPTRAHKEADQPIVGGSPTMVRLFKDIGRVARQPVSILLLGETGTGKELIARAIYRYSGLKGKPFVPINCAAIPETLLESELFGHEKGAFTGAQTRRIGRFQQAAGGMIFLDEIGEIPLSMQAKLLRVLQEKEIQPLGGNTTVKIDVRIVAATHRNLEREIAAGRFREDLYFRLNVATLYLPPLRQRREDIPELVYHFLRKSAEEAGPGGPPLKITKEALQWLWQRPWPGNIRELENTVKRAATLAQGGVIGIGQVNNAIERAPRFAEETPREMETLVDRLLAGAEKKPPKPLLAAVEKEVILVVMRKAEQNKTRAAELLGINRKTLREKLAHYGIESDLEKAAAADRD